MSVEINHISCVSVLGWSEGDVKMGEEMPRVRNEGGHWQEEEEDG